MPAEETPSAKAFATKRNVLVHKNMLEIQMLNVFGTKMNVSQAPVEQMQSVKILLEDTIANAKLDVLEMHFQDASVVDPSLTLVQTLVVDWMLSVLLEEELHSVSVLTTSQMEIPWLSAPQRKWANAEQILTVLPASLALKANV